MLAAAAAAKMEACQQRGQRRGSITPASAGSERARAFIKLPHRHLSLCRGEEGVRTNEGAAPPDICSSLPSSATPSPLPLVSSLPRCALLPHSTRLASPLTLPKFPLQLGIAQERKREQRGVGCCVCRYVLFLGVALRELESFSWLKRQDASLKEGGKGEIEEVEKACMLV